MACPVSLEHYIWLYLIFIKITILTTFIPVRAQSVANSRKKEHVTAINQCSSDYWIHINQYVEKKTFYTKLLEHIIMISYLWCCWTIPKKPNSKYTADTVSITPTVPFQPIPPQSFLDQSFCSSEFNFICTVKERKRCLNAVMQHSRTQRKCSGNKRQTSSWAMLNRCFYQKRQRELPPIQACTRQWRFAGNGQSSLDCTRQRRHYKIKAAFFAKFHLCIESVICEIMRAMLCS